jgi:glycosyltransferase involved in cell wall biosynthesis
MRIGITHYAFYPTTGGVESHLLDLARGLIRQDHEVHVLVGTMPDRPERETIDGVTVYRHDLMDPERIRSMKAEKGLAADEEDEELVRRVRRMYAEFVAEHRLDLMHGHNFHHFVPEHAIALTGLHDEGLATVLTVHEVWSEYICEDILRRSRWDAIITFCEHVTAGIRQQAPHLDNIQIVYPGIDVHRFSPENTSSKWVDALGVGGHPLIIHPARMLPWKGVVYRVQALKLVRRRFPDARLIITDTDDIVDWIRELQGYKDEVLQLIRTLGLGEAVIGQQFPYLELPWIYNACDAVVYPTVGEEPFGLVPIEAMACGRPVVVTPSGGMVESVVDGETGFFVEKRNPRQLADRIVQLLSDKGLAARMGSAGRRRAVEVFSLERMIADTVRIYERSIARHGAPVSTG